MDPEGGGGSWSGNPPQRYKNIGLLSNAGPALQKTKPVFNVGRPLLVKACFKWYFDPLSPHRLKQRKETPSKNVKNKTKKTLLAMATLTKPTGSAHGVCITCIICIYFYNSPC